MSERGVIRNRRRARQILDFSGLQFGACTPGDVDGILDLDDGKAFVIIEIKHRGAPLPDGQRRGINALARALDEAGRFLLVVVAEHDVANAGVDVDASACRVREIYCHEKKRLRIFKRHTTLGEIVRDFVDAYTQEEKTA